MYQRFIHICRYIECEWLIGRLVNLFVDGEWWMCKTECSCQFVCEINKQILCFNSPMYRTL